MIFGIKKILLISLFILIIILLVFFQNNVRDIIYSASSPFKSFFWSTGRGFSHFNQTLFNYEEIMKENLEIKRENLKLLNRTNSLEEIREENRILREALDLELKEEFKLELVSIFSKDFSQDTVLINKGKNDGIKEGLPLINENKVFYGIVEKVYNNFSHVSLISCNNNSFDIKIQNKDIFAVLKGEGNLNLFLDLIPSDKEVEEGDIIITSALEGHFPKNLLIGKVREVIKEDIKAFQKAEIDPFFQIKETDNLFILLDF